MERTGSLEVLLGIQKQVEEVEEVVFLLRFEEMGQSEELMLRTEHQTLSELEELGELLFEVMLEVLVVVELRGTT